MRNKIEQRLKSIYGKKYDTSYTDKMLALYDANKVSMPQEVRPLDHQNSYLIVYGDSFYEEDIPTFQTLHRFLKEYVKDSISDVHILPMFPYTSDDGFSVVDYLQINEDYGTWSDLEALSNDYQLMYDFVANHVSKSSPWFVGYLEDNPEYKDFFIDKDVTFDSSQVTRPRALPLFHTYSSQDGEKTVWTTFSEDQVDVNVQNINVLVALTEVLLEYIQRGATSIRLDAIGFLWKESGTTSIHLPQTHEIIKLWRDIIDELGVDVRIITETNVPHQENISYFGESDEAHMVYQFTLPPLMLHSIVSQNPQKLVEWAQTIHATKDTTFFNFLSSHDGIGVRPVEDILTQPEIEKLVEAVTQNGGFVSYKNNVDGSTSPYELNSNYIQALRAENESDEQLAQKGLFAHAFLLNFVGVPAIYYHTLLGSPNDVEAAVESGINRRINRRKLSYDDLQEQLEQSMSQTVFSEMLHLLSVRKVYQAFHPYGEQKVELESPGIVKITRTYNKESVQSYYNFGAIPQRIELQDNMYDIIHGKLIHENLIELAPFEYVWLVKKEKEKR